MNKEIGNVAGVSIMVDTETYEDIKKRKTIYENEILTELQSRIDKAIEYIEECKENHWDIDLNDLLDILRGNDNECKRNV